MPEERCTPWTLDSLLDYLCAKIAAVEKVNDERDKRYTERAQASERALAKAEHAQDQYNTSHNDLLRKMEAMMPRPEAQRQLDDLKKLVGDLQQARSSGEGRGQTWATVLLLGGLAIALIALVLNGR